MNQTGDNLKYMMFCKLRYNPLNPSSSLLNLHFQQMTQNKEGSSEAPSDDDVKFKNVVRRPFIQILFYVHFRIFLHDHLKNQRKRREEIETLWSLVNGYNKLSDKEKKKKDFRAFFSLNYVGFFFCFQISFFK